MANQSVYQQVTDKIITALEQGTIPWVRPWNGSTPQLPHNAATQRPYRGINSILLWLQAMDLGYSTDRWLTWQQAKKAGGRVRKGEKGTRVVLWLPGRMDTTDDDADQPDNRNGRTFPIARHYVVFNADQVDGLPELDEMPRDWEPHDQAERFLSLAKVRYGGDRAFYSPTPDTLQLPAVHDFDSADGYWATALHELIHWTGHPNRLNRFNDGMDDNERAEEELVAEIGSAFLCAQCGIEGQLQHAQYVSHWLERLKNDKRAIFKAASQAQKACDFLKDQVEGWEAVTEGVIQSLPGKAGYGYSGPVVPLSGEEPPETRRAPIRT